MTHELNTYSSKQLWSQASSWKPPKRLGNWMNVKESTLTCALNDFTVTLLCHSCQSFIFKSKLAKITTAEGENLFPVSKSSWKRILRKCFETHPRKRHKHSAAGLSSPHWHGHKKQGNPILKLTETWLMMAQGQTHMSCIWNSSIQQECELCLEIWITIFSTLQQSIFSVYSKFSWKRHNNYICWCLSTGTSLHRRKIPQDTNF